MQVRGKRFCDDPHRFPTSECYPPLKRVRSKISPWLLQVRAMKRAQLDAAGPATKVQRFTSVIVDSSDESLSFTTEVEPSEICESPSKRLRAASSP